MWMVRASYDQKPYRKMLMETYGATVYPSPSDRTSAGRAILAEHPDSPGSLGIAISEAVEVAGGDPAASYSLGSVLNHVLMHQTVIGEEALKQLAEAGDTPDVIVGCTGGGSNFGGLAFPFLREKLAGRINPVIRAVEPAACPSFTRGMYAYDFGDTAGFTPLLKMHTLGHDFVPDPIHAGGLRYHGMSPLLSHIYELGLIEAVAKPQSECFAAGLRFARTEGIVPAPEPTHAVAASIEEALRCKETGEEKVILTALCGHGLLDLAAYENYLAGQLKDYELPERRSPRRWRACPPGCKADGDGRGLVVAASPAVAASAVMPAAASPPPPEPTVMPAATVPAAAEEAAVPVPMPCAPAGNTVSLSVAAGSDGSQPSTRRPARLAPRRRLSTAITTQKSTTTTTTTATITHVMVRLHPPAVGSA